MGQAVRDSSGAIVGAQGAIQDISDKKQAEQEVRALATRLTTTLESITDAFYTLDREWRFTYVNSEAERLLKHSRADLMGHVLWEVFPVFVGSEFERQFRDAIEHNCSVAFGNYYAPWQQWFECHVYPSKPGSRFSLRDVTGAPPRPEALEAAAREPRGQGGGTHRRTRVVQRCPGQRERRCARWSSTWPTASSPSRTAVSSVPQTQGRSDLRPAVGLVGDLFSPAAKVRPSAAKEQGPAPAAVAPPSAGEEPTEPKEHPQLFPIPLNSQRKSARRSCATSASGCASWPTSSRPATTPSRRAAPSRRSSRR